MFGVSFFGSFLEKREQELKQAPFFAVTNREFSLFLWQFPSYMRKSVKRKTGYLTGFKEAEENFEIEMASQNVVAPPELLLLYHVWKRLLSESQLPSEIKKEEFLEFLSVLPEWHPERYKLVAGSYSELLRSPLFFSTDNLVDLPVGMLPLDVQRAFLGWKLYYKMGKEINNISPSKEEIERFLQKRPAYQYSLWKNFDMHRRLDEESRADWILEKLPAFFKYGYLLEATNPSS